jgi:hypothetical protein
MAPSNQMSNTLLTVQDSPFKIDRTRRAFSMRVLGTEGDAMAVVQFSESVNDPELVPLTGDSSGGANDDWLLYAAAGTLVASGVLLVTGNRKAGLAVAATGAALAMLDQQETVKAVWDALPEYLGEIQGLLARIEGTVEEISAQGARLRSALGK